MQFTTLSVAFFAALATAHQHAPQHFHHRRQLNGTGPSTTLTVYATSIHTITSCAASITNCPARTSGVVVTDIVVLTTTVCPVADASSVASAVLASHSATAPLATTVSAKGEAVSSTEAAAGVISSPAVLLSTGSGPAASAYASGSDSVVLTYTLGTGTSTTVVTTTIKHVKTNTIYSTVAASTSEAAGAVSSKGPTTTIFGTSTSTRYITVVPATTVSGAGGVSAVEGVVAASGACVPVTVTVALSTITVTETAIPVSATAVVSALAQADVEASTSADVVIIKSTATVLPVLATTAPYGNSTVSTKTKKKCSSVFPTNLRAKATTGSAPVQTGY